MRISARDPFARAVFRIESARVICVSEVPQKQHNRFPQTHVANDLSKRTSLLFLKKAEGWTRDGTKNDALAGFFCTE